MNLVEILNKAIKDQNWNLVEKALHIINGNMQEPKSDSCNIVQKIEKANPFMINKPVIVKTQSNTIKPTENQFVDDLSLESNLIEKSPEVKKKYRKPNESTYVDVQCSNCNKTYSITKEEFKFKSSDSESSPFTCIKCIRSMSKR